MDFTAWLKAWLARHPLKAPSEELRADYTAEVMDRIRRLHAPPAPARSWLTWPSLSLGTALAAAAVLLVVGRMPRQALPGREPQRPPVVLAESPLSDEQWISQTIQLLDQVEEGSSGASEEPAASGPADDQMLLEELQLFDESELASTS